MYCIGYNSGDCLHQTDSLYQFYINLITQHSLILVLVRCIME